LLRVLETGEFLKVGSSEVQTTDVRVVAASNKNLLTSIQKGKFREDLYYRLSTVQIETPALRERGNDIELLFRKFVSDFAEKNRVENIRLTPDAVNLLLRYAWPGNVRQLKNIAEQCAILANDKEVDALELSRFIPDNVSNSLPKVVDQNSGNENFSEREILYKIMFDLKKDMNELKQFVLQMAKFNNFSTDKLQNLDNNSTNDYQEFPKNDYPLESVLPVKDSFIIREHNQFSDSEEVEETHSLADMEKMMILKSLEKFKGKRKDAADELGISERTLYRKIKEYEINL
jgi:DNA-binding NtrC family response regulator